MRIFCAVLVLSLAYAQSAGLHYHGHHDESASSASHEIHHLPHPAATIHTNGLQHEVMAEVETFGPLTLQSGSISDLPYLFAAVLLLTALFLGGDMLLRAAPPWKPKLHHARLRPPLRAPPI